MAYKFQMGTGSFSGSIQPTQDDEWDIGTSAAQYKDIYIDGIGYIDQLGTDADAVTVYVNAGEIDGTVIGGETPAAATVTTLNLTSVGGNWTNAGRTVADMGTLTTVAITTVAGTPNFTGIATHAATEVFNNGLSVKNGTTSAGFIKFFEDGDFGSDAITLSGPGSNHGDVNLTLPTVAGTLVTDAGMGGNIDIGAYDLRASTMTADGLTAGRVVFAGTAGVLSDDADFSFATDTLTVTKLGAYEQAGAVNFSDEAMTNVNIDSGVIDNVVIGGTTAVAGTFAAIKGTTISGSSTLEAGGALTVAGTSALQAVSMAGALTANGNVTLGNSGADSLTFHPNAWTLSNAVTITGTWTNLGSVTTTDINGGTVDGVTIGGSSAGGGTFTTLNCTDGAFAIANLDIDGGADIGAAIVDADLFIIDDGAGGLNRKCAASRLKTYIQSGAGDSISVKTLTLNATCSAGMNVVTGSNVAMTVCLPSGSDGDVIYVKAGSNASPLAKVSITGSAATNALPGSLMDGQKTLALESPYATVGFVYSDDAQYWTII